MQYILEYRKSSAIDVENANEGDTRILYYFCMKKNSYPIIRRLSLTILINNAIFPYKVVVILFMTFQRFLEPNTFIRSMVWYQVKDYFDSYRKINI